MKFNYLWILYALLSGVGVYYLYLFITSFRTAVLMAVDVMTWEEMWAYLFQACLAWAAIEILRRLDKMTRIDE